MVEAAHSANEKAARFSGKRQPIPFFAYRSGALHCEGVPVSEIAAKVGTPAYIYSAASVLKSYRDLAKGFAPAKPIICYSVKANANLGLLRLMAREGAGMDVVSGGEIFRALKAGADPRKIVYAGVGKTDEEIAYALRVGILMFNVESEPELENINAIARRMGRSAGVALRLNPDVDPKTHVYITTGKRENKFGIDLERAGRIVADMPRMPQLRLVGLHMHIGSQITQTGPHAQALRKAVRFIEARRDQMPDLQYINIGGGFGVLYDLERPPSARDFAARLLPLVKRTGLRLVMEPGRFIVGDAGILVTRVLYVKESGGDKKFVICDAAMNDLIRPTLYDAYHRIWPVQCKVPLHLQKTNKGLERVDVVGPICESGDFLGKDRPLPPVRRGDLLAVFSAGAYGHTMSSNYNQRPRACEVIVQGKRFTVARRRETYQDLIASEL